MAELWTGGRIVLDCGNPSLDAEAMLTAGGKILALGPESDLLQHPEIRRIHQLRGATLYPGFRDPHCHFLYLGLGSFQADLRKAESEEEAIALLREFAAQNPSGWLQGRGWNQESWDSAEFPDKQLLDKAFPDRPVYLTRVDGHAAWVNSRALELAGIDRPQRIEGGEILGSGGKPDGMLVDSAMDLVKNLIPPTGPKDWERALLRAQEKCFRVGLTGVGDAGLSLEHYRTIMRMQLAGDLQMPIYGMLTPDAQTETFFRNTGPIEGPKLHLRGFKYYADGALGSRGARLLEDYSDMPGEKGLWMHEHEYLLQQAARNRDQGFQMVCHAIGDAAVRQVLDVYEAVAAGPENRWRIEHAQIVNPRDLARFAESGIWASIQTCHGVSDREMAVARLGQDRLAHAYHARKFIEAGIPVTNGSDFPIEDESPIRGFVTAVFRKEMDGLPADGFRPEEALTRKQGLEAMTIQAARSQFEEDWRGDIQPGKYAEFTLLDCDIRTAPEAEVRSARVLGTVVDGKWMFRDRGWFAENKTLSDTNQ